MKNHVVLPMAPKVQDAWFTLFMEINSVLNNEHDDLELSVDVKFDDCLPSSASSSRAISPFQMVDERTL